MALLEKAPTQEPTPRLNDPGLGLPRPTTPPAAQPAQRSVWPTFVERVAVAVVGLGVVVATGLGVVNRHDSDTLQSHVKSLQSQMATTQDQLAAARAEVATTAGLPTAQDLAADQATVLTGKIAASQARAGQPIPLTRTGSDLATERAMIVAGKILAAQSGTSLSRSMTGTSSQTPTEAEILAAAKIAAAQARAGLPITR